MTNRPPQGYCDCNNRIASHNNKLIEMSAKSLGDMKKAFQAAQKKEESEMDI